MSQYDAMQYRIGFAVGNGFRLLKAPELKLAAGEKTARWAPVLQTRFFVQ